MSGAVLGLIVILGMTVINLFLGFSLAVLFGRAPSSWEEVMAAVEFRTLELTQRLTQCHWSMPRLRLPQLRWKTPAKSVAVASPIARRVSSDARPVDGKIDGKSMTAVAPVAGPAAMVRLAPLPVDEPSEELPYDVVLEQQLMAWQDGDLHDIAACAAMLVVMEPGRDADPTVRSLVLNALHDTVVSQVRKDRQVVTPSEDRFVWFLDDMEAEDALIPVERIRQMIEKTAFHREGQPIDVALRVMIVTAQSDDAPRQLLNRLEAAFEFSQQCATKGIVLDLGEGPSMRSPLEMEIQETELALA